MTNTIQQDTDENVLANLQSLGTSATISGYSSASGKVVTWEDGQTPTALDQDMVLGFFQCNGDVVLV